jgi:hypothetical protein
MKPFVSHSDVPMCCVVLTLSFVRAELTGLTSAKTTVCKAIEKGGGKSRTKENRKKMDGRGWMD